MSKQKQLTAEQQFSNLQFALNTASSLLVEAVLPPIPGHREFERQFHQFTGTKQAVDAAADRLLQDHLLPQLLPTLQTYVDQNLVGKVFDQVESVAVAKSFSKMLQRLGCSVECVCGGSVSVIRYVKMGDEKWHWRFEHSPSVRHASRLRLPPLKLIPMSSFLPASKKP